MVLDVEKLKAHKGAGGAPFLEFRSPDGDIFYAYSIKALGNMRAVPSKFRKKPQQWANFVVLDLKPDGVAVLRLERGQDGNERSPNEFVEVTSPDMLKEGQSIIYTIDCARHAGLEMRFETHKPIKDKVFHVMNRGKVRTKKGYMATDYVLIPAEEAAKMSTRSLRLRRKLPERSLERALYLLRTQGFDEE